MTQKPIGWMYTTNGTWTWVVSEEPPEDAYDEGSLQAIYTEAQTRQAILTARSELIAEIANLAIAWGNARKPNYGGQALRNFADSLLLRKELIL